MNKLILVNFKDGKQIKLDPKQIVSTSQIAKMTVQTPPNESSESKNELDFLSQIDLGSSNSSDYFTESDADAGVRSILVEDFDEDEDQDEDSSDDEDAKSSQSQTSGDAGAKPKKKRQRLTHLSEEEKLARRKMKNRVAAQSARDRKKAKMDGLEEETKSLRVQNEKLRNENKLLKEKTKLLLDENRKLLGKLKQQATASPVGASVPASASVAVEAVASLQPRADSSSVISLKRKFDQMKTTRGVEESAAFSIDVSQQQKQLHLLFPQLIYTLIFYTMNLLKSEQATLNSLTRCYNSSNQHKSSPVSLHQIRAVNLRVLKLKATLVKLLKLLKMQRSSQRTTAASLQLARSAMADNNSKLMLLLPSRLLRTTSQTASSQQQSSICNTILLASLIAKLARRKQHLLNHQRFF